MESPLLAPEDNNFLKLVAERNICQNSQLQRFINQ